MHKHAPVSSFLVLALGLSATAQDVLYYKLDENGGKKAVNYASGSGVAPAEGTLVGTYAAQWAPGVLGLSALQGGIATNATSSTSIDTGWTPNLANSNFTLAFFMKQRTAPPSTNYFFYANSGFRMFTGGVAAKGLYFRNGTSGTGGDWILTTDIQTLAAAAWLHVAIVVDATALTATYYLNGVAQPAITIASGVSATGGTYPWRIAGFASYGGLYDIDEYRVTLKVATAAEVMSWATKTSPADGPYGKACNGASLKSNGNPQLGNATYALTVTGNVGGLYALGIGSNRLSFASLPCPLDLGFLSVSLAGCFWESSGDAFVGGVLAGGTSLIPLPIPLVLSFDGVSLWNQAIVIGGGTDQLTNAFVIGLGQ